MKPLCERDGRGRTTRIEELQGIKDAFPKLRKFAEIRSQAKAQAPALGKEAGPVPTWRAGEERGGASLARPRPVHAGVVPAAGENRRAVRDVCVRSPGHGGATTARSNDDSGPGLEPKTAATAGVPAARRGSVGLRDRREATDS